MQHKLQTPNCTFLGQSIILLLSIVEFPPHLSIKITWSVGGSNLTKCLVKPLVLLSLSAVKWILCEPKLHKDLSDS